jgi:hypothetical protein
LGAAGVAIESAPVKGVLKLPFSTLKVGLPALLNAANRHKVVVLTPKQFHYAFTNTLDARDAAAMHERYSVPGPSRVVFQVSLANFVRHAVTRVGLENDERAPLLLIAGSEDRFFPPRFPSTTSSSTASREQSPPIGSFPTVPTSRSARPRWEQVADYALTWALDSA